MSALAILVIVLLTGCATAIVPAKVKYVALYEVPQPGLPTEGQGAVATLHTSQLKLFLPNNRGEGVASIPICFRLVPGQDRKANPYLVQWESLKQCGGSPEIDEQEDLVQAQMGGSMEKQFPRLLITFPGHSRTHPYPAKGCFAVLTDPPKACIEMIMDVGMKEVSKMYLIVYPRADANLWDILDGLQTE